MATPAEDTPSSIKYPVTLQGTPFEGYYLEVPASRHQDFITTHIGEPLSLTLQGTKGVAALTVEAIEQTTKRTTKKKIQEVGEVDEA